MNGRQNKTKRDSKQQQVTANLLLLF